MSGIGHHLSFQTPRILKNNETLISNAKKQETNIIIMKDNNKKGG